MPRVRWFQYRLRTLLVVMALVAVGLAAYRAYVAPYQRQRQTMKLIENLGGRYQTAAAAKWLRWVYGNDFENVVLVDLADCDQPAKYLDAIVALPHLATLIVGGEEFTDEHARRLRSLPTLSGLILDSTSATPEGLAELKQTFPHVEIYQSQRRWIAAFEQVESRGGTFAAGIMLFKNATDAAATLRALASAEYFREAEAAELAAGFGDIGLVHLKGMASLEALFAHIKGVTDAGLAHLKNLRNLKELGLCGANVTDVGLVHLKVLQSLEWLSLAETSVTDAGLSHLAGLTSLRELDLSDTRVTDGAIPHLKRLTSLERLIVVGTRLTAAGAAELRKALPGCDVVHP